MNYSIIATLCLILSTVFPSYGQLGKLAPVDEGHCDHAFASFREKLIEAVQKKDTAFIADIIARQAYVPCKGGERVSKKSFMDFYFPRNEDPDHSKLWSLLQEILEVGGGKFKMEFTPQGNIIDYFYAPYTSVDLIEGRDDLRKLGTYCIITGEHIHVKEKPDVSSATIAQLSYDIVKYTPENYSKPQEKWMAIELPDGRKGYVSRDFTRGLFEARAGFTRENNQWKLAYADYFESMKAQ